MLLIKIIATVVVSAVLGNGDFFGVAAKTSDLPTLGMKTETQANLSGVNTGRENASGAGLPKILFYSDWSAWSACNGRCEKTRQRRCLDSQKCGNIVLKETHVCPSNGDRHNRRKCQRAQNRRKHRHKTDEFHVNHEASAGTKHQPKQKSSPVKNRPKTIPNKRKTSRKPPAESSRKASLIQLQLSFPVPLVQHWPDFFYSQWAGPFLNGRSPQTTPNQFNSRSHQKAPYPVNSKYYQQPSSPLNGRYYQTTPNPFNGRSYHTTRNPFNGRPYHTTPNPLNGRSYHTIPNPFNGRSYHTTPNPFNGRSYHTSQNPFNGRSYHTTPNPFNGRSYHTTPNPFLHPSGHAGWPNYMQQAVHQQDSSVIFPTSGSALYGSWSDVTRLPSNESQLYGKWTRWSKCTRDCTTHRRRNCKRRDLCGDSILKESAYCYVEDSYCQRWIQRKMQQNDQAFENEAIQDHTYPESVYSSRKTTEKTKTTSPSAAKQAKGVKGSLGRECGIAANNASKSLGNMLRIIGGRPTAKGRWPWQVAVLNRFREAFCGGTLIASRWVITAAHCVRKRLYVRIGEHDLSEKEGTETELRVDEMIPHPDYNEETVDNDVALLRLPVPVQAGRDRGMACLPKPRQMLPTNRYCTIIGWGKRTSADSFGTDVLHEAEVPIVPNDLCRQVYEDYHITGNMFCAGYPHGQMDTCAGDSGGPLLCLDGDRWTIFGITSFGEGCGKHGKYGIYTRLPNFVKWIQKIIDD